MRHFAASGLEASRPNTMNRTGFMFAEVGLLPAFDFAVQMLGPIAERLLPEWTGPIDSARTFSVRPKLLPF